MNLTRNGKIARLPKTIRAELNQRLANGERGTGLVAWLNGLPEVQRIIAEQFGGKPVRAQNLSEWKQGGYQDWLNKQEAMEAVRQRPAGATGLQGPDGEPCSEILGTWLTAHYAVVAYDLQKNGKLDWKRVQKMCRDVSALRRADHNAARLKLEMEKLEHARKRTEAEMIAQFVRWVKNPAIQELLRRHGVSAEERGGEAGKAGQWVSEPVGQKPCARHARSKFRVQRSARTPVSNSRLKVQSHPDLCALAPWRESSVCAGNMRTRVICPSNFMNGLMSDSFDTLHEKEAVRFDSSSLTHLTNHHVTIQLPHWPIRLNPTFEILAESFNE
jgi:hypothetical protein